MNLEKVLGAIILAHNFSNHVNKKWLGFMGDKLSDSLEKYMDALDVLNDAMGGNDTISETTNVIALATIAVQNGDFSAADQILLVQNNISKLAFEVVAEVGQVFLDYNDGFSNSLLGYNIPLDNDKEWGLFDDIMEIVEHYEK